MRGFNSVLAVALVAITVTAPAMAQSLNPGIYMTADHNMRSSKVIGTTVYNDHNEKIGVVDDILLPATGGEVTAVLSFGGFLGVGQKLVKVPLSHVHFAAGKPMMPDADKPALMAMPQYNYAGGNG
jgi:sporulation protein YlmC with PRC-barrel domain